MVERLAAQVARRVEREPVGEGGERPLARRGRDQDQRDRAKRGGEADEVDPPRADDAVDGAAGKRGDGQGAHGHGGDQRHRRGESDSSAREEPEHAADDLGIAHRDTSSSVSCDSQISR